MEVNAISKDEENLGKFDTRVDEGILLGYSTKRKVYICYNKRLRRVVESKNVKVDEDTLKNTVAKMGYESDESTRNPEEEKVEETKVGDDKEYVSKITPKTLRYVHKNHLEK